jgi:hypothetical protein
MQAYFNDPSLKAKLQDELRKHYEADAIVSGTYGEGASNAVGFRGCAVGCVLHSLGARWSGDYQAYKDLLQWPAELGAAQDAIFEGLHRSGLHEEAREFPQQFADAIAVGADLSDRWLRIGLWLLTNETHGIRKVVEGENAVMIDQLIDMYQKRISGEKVAQEDIDNLALALARARDLALARALDLARDLDLDRDLARDLARALARALALALDLARDRPAYWLAVRDMVLDLLRTAPIGVTATA